MKKFLFKLFVCILLPLGIFFGGCEVYFAQQGNFYTKKKETIENNIENAETIIVGSSHGLYGVNTDLFKKPALNLSNVSQDVYYSDQVLRHYLDQAKNLKRVVVILSSSSLDLLLEKSVEEWRSHYYKKVFGINPYEERDGWFSPKDYSYTAMNYDRLFQYLRKGVPNDDTKLLTPTGFYPAPVPSKEMAELRFTPEQAKSRVALHTIVYGDYRPLNQEIIESLIKDLKDRQIEVVLVTLPAYKTYATAFDKPWIRAVFKAYEDIARRNNVKYLNLFTDSRFQKSDFYDNDHLNEQGAAKLSRILIKKLEK